MARENSYGGSSILETIVLRSNPSPVVELNRAVAISMRGTPQAGLTLIDAILARGELHDYHLTYP